MKAKNYLNKFWMDFVKNRCGLLAHGALQSAISREGIDELS